MRFFEKGHIVLIYKTVSTKFPLNKVFHIIIIFDDKMLDRTANSAGPDQTSPRSSLI